MLTSSTVCFFNKPFNRIRSLALCGYKSPALFKDNKFFLCFLKKITKQTAKTLLAHKEITYIDLVSKKSGKKYKATIVMSIDDKSNYPIFSLRFDN